LETIHSQTADETFDGTGRELTLNVDAHVKDVMPSLSLEDESFTSACMTLPFSLLNRHFGPND